MACHLVAAGECLAVDDLDGALAHARHAAGRAGRVACVREALGMVYYRQGEWAKALAEFRTARRLSGSDHLLPALADVERGLGRPERAIEISQSPEAAALPAAGQVDMAIVVSGARRDLGQNAAAVEMLRAPAERARPSQPWAARLWYAYADALLGVGRQDEARDFFARAAGADTANETDVAERLAELDGVTWTDLGEDEEPGGPEAGTAVPDLADASAPAAETPEGGSADDV